MNQIINNKFVRVFNFSSSSEADYFLQNQKVNNILSLEDTFGEYDYCVVCGNSLTRKIEFVLSFKSDEKDENLNLLFWQEPHLIVLHTGRGLYLIDGKLTVIATFEITTPLVGLFLTSGNNLLVLEEASYRLIDSTAKILSGELFDLMENFSLDGNKLSVHTYDNASLTFNLV